MEGDAKKRYLKYLEAKGKMPKKPLGEDEEASVDVMFPKKMADGGMVDDESDDERIMNYHEHDSSGEPHTDDKYEDEDPMEFMAMGGLVDADYNRGQIVDVKKKTDYDQSPNPYDDLMKEMYSRKMSKGGMAKKMAFAKALKKSY